MCFDELHVLFTSVLHYIIDVNPQSASSSIRLWMMMKLLCLDSASWAMQEREPKAGISYKGDTLERLPYLIRLFSYMLIYFAFLQICMFLASFPVSTNQFGGFVPHAQENVILYLCFIVNESACPPVLWKLGIHRSVIHPFQ